MDSSLYTVAAPIVFNREIHVHYGQFYVQSRSDFFVGLIESLGGQANGLCGAAVPGLLFLITGLHTGHTSVTVEMLGAPAPIGDEWEDVVEASFRPATAKVALVQWAGEASWPRIEFLRSTGSQGVGHTAPHAQPLAAASSTPLWAIRPSISLT